MQMNIMTADAWTTANPNGGTVVAIWKKTVTARLVVEATGATIGEINDQIMKRAESAFQSHWEIHNYEGIQGAKLEWGPREGYILDLQDLCDHFGADSPRLLNHRIYKDTDCGASISLYADEVVIHNGQPAYSLVDGGEIGDASIDSVEEFEGAYGPLTRFTIQTIVEGSDVEINSEPFEIPCTKVEIVAWIAEMEAQATAEWDNANK